MFVRSAALALALALALSAPTAFGAAGFDYNPDSGIGPPDWASLAIDDNQCGGSENSPIAITDSGCNDYGDYILRPGSCTYDDITFEVNDHGVKASFNGSTCELPNMEMPGKEGVYDALQFHIHTGSEHTVNGVTFGAELHIVHLRRDCPTDEQRCYAVVGTKLNPASNYDNELFHIFLEGWIEVHNAKEQTCGRPGNIIEYEGVTSATTLVDPYQFNRRSRFFHYPGGLTTPGCNEMVWWNLDDEPLAISPEQYSDLGRIILDYSDDSCAQATVAHHGSTSRPTQDIGDRTVTKICPKAYAPEPVYCTAPPAGPSEPTAPTPTPPSPTPPATVPTPGAPTSPAPKPSAPVDPAVPTEPAQGSSASTKVAAVGVLCAGVFAVGQLF